MTPRDFAKFWLPVLIWMAMIFTASTDLGSAHHTSRIIGPFLRFFSPTISDETIGHVQTVVRKTGHVSGYAVLAILVWRARRRAFLPATWDAKSARFAQITCTLYACSDEFHQSFVPTRQGSAWDVVIDSLGAAGALGLMYFIGKRRRKW